MKLSMTEQEKGDLLSGFIEPQILNLERTTIRRDMYYQYVIQS
jgi:hypothetical protein